ncbi:MAG TPA: hypothetical protein VIU85_09045 [Chthoniobacterales bacterium]
MPRIFTLAITLIVAFVGESGAQSLRRHEPIYTSQVADTGVPLQPFSFKREPASARAIQVAYYTSPHVRPTQPIQRDDDESDSRSTFDVGGSHPMVPGNRAILRNGIAYAPSNAPDSVKHAIWAVNSICGRPYVWGGGHGSFHDYGYDCSGTVSYALHYAGMLQSPIPSSDFLRYGEPGHGRWVTIYSRHGHVFAMIAGLRLDTTDFRYGGDVGPRWHLNGRSTSGFQARHPAKL